MKTINELQDEVIEEFSDFDDWMDKYQLLIDLGNEQEPLAPNINRTKPDKTVARAAYGCRQTKWTEKLFSRPKATH